MSGRVGGAGDNGADVVAVDPVGQRWVIQCKHRKQGISGAAVGVQDFHILNGTGRSVISLSCLVIRSGSHAVPASASAHPRSQPADARIGQALPAAERDRGVMASRSGRARCRPVARGPGSAAATRRRRV
ncbi:restriction endonuclease [Streptomyces sp. NRRL F-5630]|uniref:restriction endonuclease n=1 Tax=Streptomyces sp. NRRL F-5630 TaxID=1463864 RepID=UPI003D714F19